MKCFSHWLKHLHWVLFHALPSSSVLPFLRLESQGADARFPFLQVSSTFISGILRAPYFLASATNLALESGKHPLYLPPQRRNFFPRTVTHPLSPHSCTFSAEWCGGCEEEKKHYIWFPQGWYFWDLLVKPHWSVRNNWGIFLAFCEPALPFQCNKKSHTNILLFMPPKRWSVFYIHISPGA